MNTFILVLFSSLIGALIGIILSRITISRKTQKIAKAETTKAALASREDMLAFLETGLKPRENIKSYELPCSTEDEIRKLEEYLVPRVQDGEYVDEKAPDGSLNTEILERIYSPELLARIDQQLEEDPQNRDLLEIKAFVLSCSNVSTEFWKALKCYDKIIDFYPDHSCVYSYKAEAFHTRMNKIYLQKSIHLYDEILGSGLTEEDRHLLFLEQCNAYIKFAENEDVSILSFVKFIDESDSSDETKDIAKALVCCLLFEDKTSAAIRYLDKIDMDKYPVFLLYKVYILVHQCQYDEALLICEKLLAENKDDEYINIVDVYSYMAVIYMGKGDEELALKYKLEAEKAALVLESAIINDFTNFVNEFCPN